jgi:hypothetical protein
MKNLLIVTLSSLIAVAGCGKKEDDTAKTVGNKVGQTLTNFAKGVGQGIDKEMTVETELSQELIDQGISKTISKSSGIDHPDQKGITLYLNSKNAFKATLIAKAFNAEGQEIGRSTADPDMAQDDAKYVTFTFDNEMDTQLVKKYIISIKK